mmetsp:Transcript_19238/g.48362  ORF Transcript_19238/g.48362 Transcript_19238/m.48362 type:complete len:231 (-) Transcript_19238:353-1045(-)
MHVAASLRGPRVEQRGHEPLREAARVQAGRLAVQLDALDECGRPGRPAETHAAREQLGEGVEAQHAPVAVEREQRGPARRAARRAVLQPVVRVVLEDQQVVRPRDLVHALPPRQTERGARRVAAGGDRVEHARPPPPPVTPLVPTGQDLLEVGGVEAVGVAPHAHELAADRPQVGQRAGVGGRLDEQRVALVEQRVKGLGERVRAPGGNADLTASHSVLGLLQRLQVRPE